MAPDDSSAVDFAAAVADEEGLRGIQEGDNEAIAATAAAAEPR